ncbi:MAG: zf-HC2 domain-containing protein [candidate division Zixibacteria bacterium]|nr:zf-HC2 domain-containing protein [candidate division Zixibacteria bacterium]
MRCRKVRSFLSTFSKGETAPEVAARIEHHLDDCPSCRRELDVYRSLNKSYDDLPQLKASDDFNARLFQKIGQENFAEKRSKAYMPKRIPRFGSMRLATYAATAVIVLSLGFGMNFSNDFLAPSSPQVANTTNGQSDDLYLTAQPTDNPLLNERKSVSTMVQQYNRFREYSKSLRTNIAVEQLLSNASQTTLTASGMPATVPAFRVRPVVKNYLVIPNAANAINTGAVY